METFIRNKGKTSEHAIHARNIDRSPIPKNEPMPTPSPPVEDPFAGMTPKQRMVKKKEIKAQKEVEKLKLAAGDAKQNYEKANQRKQDELWSSGSHKMKDYVPDQNEHTTTNFGHDRAEDTYMVSSMGTGMSGMSIHPPAKKEELPDKKFSSYED